MKKAKITIDYFEFIVLIEAAWHNGTILRASIMQKAVDNWYHQLTNRDRDRAYQFFLRTKGDDIKTNLQKHFMARYDPGNQYRVDDISLYKYNKKYHSFIDTFLDDKHNYKAKKVR